MSDIIPNVVISMPSQLFTLRRKFAAASNGKVYIGKIDMDPTIPENQIQVYLENEDGSYVPVAQPIIVNQAGYPVYNGQIAKFVTVEGHSMVVYDSYGAQQFYFPNILKYDPDQFSKILAGDGGDKMVGSSFGGTVYSDYQRSGITRNGEFGSTITVNNANQAIYYKDDGFWYTSKSTSFPVNVPSFPNDEWDCVGMLNGYPIYDVRNWGLVGDDYTDNTTNWINMIKKINGKYLTIYFPAGIYRYTDIGNVLMPRTTWKGDGSMRTSFRCTNTDKLHVALNIDAFVGGENSPFLDSFNMEGIHIEGNENTGTIINMQGNSRNIWKDVTFWGANQENGTGMWFRGCMLGEYTGLMCSGSRTINGKYPGVFINIPKYGMQWTAGRRGNKSVEQPANNTFINLYMENMPRGLNMDWGDGNVFISGSCEACSDYGLAISSKCRFNTLIGVGFENKNAITADVVNTGLHTKFFNCYSSQRFAERGIGSFIDGGLYERMEIQNVSASSTVRNLRVSYWGTDKGGFFDSGVGTVKDNIYDHATSNYIYTTDTKHIISLAQTIVGDSTIGTWDNVTRLPVTLFIQGSSNIESASIITKTGTGESFALPTSSIQQIHLEFADRISIRWVTNSGRPIVSYRSQCGKN